MASLPDFSNYGYTLLRELGRNPWGGRVTYLARTDTENTATESYCVIKQFRFAGGSQWEGFKAYEREVRILQQLDHPGIPHYLDSFETENGFCLVQEYKAAEPLSIARPWLPEEVKRVAIAVLEILQYLQEAFTQPVIHRDLKPENILIDAVGQVYLVDFGFARVGTQDVALSSVALGTIGFMPPEQLYNREITSAADLYGLGATLICLLTGVKSVDVDRLIDEDNRFQFRDRLPKLSRPFLDWLTTMVQPRVPNRYPTAAIALAALHPIDLIRAPEVQIRPNRLELTAQRINQMLIGDLFIHNPIDETTLEGYWEIEADDREGVVLPEEHAWIHLKDPSFVGNRHTAIVTVDTSQIRSNGIYRRNLLLHTNASAEPYKIPLTITTANTLQSLAHQKLPYQSLILLMLCGFLSTLFFGVDVTGNPHVPWVEFARTLIIVAGVLMGAAMGPRMIPAAHRSSSNVVTLLVTGIAIFLGMCTGPLIGVLVCMLLASPIGWVALVVCLLEIAHTLGNEKFPRDFAYGFPLALAILAATFGASYRWPMLDGLLLSGLLSGGAAIAWTISLPVRSHLQQIAQRRRETHLLPPDS